MALPAGRVGVAPNQVDSNGNVIKQPVPTAHIEVANLNSLQATGILFITINELVGTKEVVIGGNTFYMFGENGATGSFPVAKGDTVIIDGGTNSAYVYYIK